MDPVASELEKEREIARVQYPKHSELEIELEVLRSYIAGWYLAEPVRRRLAMLETNLRLLVKKQGEFKKYVHERLDGMEVPHEVPESEHTAAGCRVGGRLDYVEGRLEERELFQKDLHALSDAIRTYMRTESLGEGRAAEALIKEILKRNPSV